MTNPATRALNNLMAASISAFSGFPGSGASGRSNSKLSIGAEHSFEAAVFPRHP